MSLKTLQKQTLQSKYGLIGCVNHEATGNSTYEATLKCNRIGYVDSVPLPQPSPQSQHSPSTTSRFTSLHIAQLLSAFLLQNTVYVNEAFTSYPLCLSIKIT